MKKTAKILLTAFIFALLTVILCVTAYAANGISEFSVGTASASDATQLGAVKWFKSDADGKYYVFLPDGKDGSNLTVWFNADDKVMCGDTQLANGLVTNVFTGGGEFILTCGDKSYTLVVLQGNGIGTVYINTESGSLDKVHADKEYKEPGSILIIDEEGNVQYNDDLDYIKGRGNSTWLANKKPYNIKLAGKTNLFGMGKSKKWCLLANASDASLIKNALAYDFARHIGVDTTSDTVQVNLYINGNYEGVYLVTEKVEIGDNRIEIYDLEGATEDVNSKDLDSYKLAGAQNVTTFGTIKYADIPNDPENITGGYLLELEKIYRYVDEPSGFITDIGQAVVVKSPEYATKAQVEYISTYYQEFEDALYSPTGYNSLGKHYSTYIDVESLARMYILNEFTVNFDGCSSSFYLYKDIDGKLTAGPAWDYDLSLGVVASNDLINHVKDLSDPSLLYIQTCYIGNHSTNKNALLAQAFSHNEFQDIVERMWNQEVALTIDTFNDNIGSFGDTVRNAAVMNAIRWNIYSTADTAVIAAHHKNAVNAIKKYVNARYPFLTDVYSPDTYFVKYDIGKYGTALVRDTTVYRAGNNQAVVLSAPASSDNLILFDCWTTNPDGTGDAYHAGDVITLSGNTTLYAQWKTDSSISGIIKSFLRTISNFFNKIREFFSGIFK